MGEEKGKKILEKSKYVGLVKNQDGRCSVCSEPLSVIENGKKVNIIATDDSHFHIDDAFGGWVMVKSEINNQESLLEALKNGHYYSSQGPDFKNIKVQEGRLEVLCSPVEKIIVSGYGSATTYKHKSNMESALFNLALLPQKKWLRITIIDKKGNRAWTNPIYDY